MRRSPASGTSSWNLPRVSGSGRGPNHCWYSILWEEASDSSSSDGIGSFSGGIGQVQAETISMARRMSLLNTSQSLCSARMSIVESRWSHDVVSGDRTRLGGGRKNPFTIELQRDHKWLRPDGCSAGRSKSGNSSRGNNANWPVRLGSNAGIEGGGTLSERNYF